MSRSASEHYLAAQIKQGGDEPDLYRCKCGWEHVYEEEVEGHIERKRAVTFPPTSGAAAALTPDPALERAGGAAIMPTPGAPHVAVERGAKIALPIQARIQVRFDDEVEPSWETHWSYMAPGDTLTWKYEPHFTID